MIMFLMWRSFFLLTECTDLSHSLLHPALFGISNRYTLQTRGTDVFFNEVHMKNKDQNGPPQLLPSGTPPLATEEGLATAENFIAEKHIGERIKRLRLKKSMGLVELGRHTGLSASFLSQLETGRVVPTLRNLARLAMVFSKDLSYFFDSEPQAIFRVHRRSERMRLPQTGVEVPSYFFESLGYMIPDRLMDPYFAEFVPQEPDQTLRSHLHSGFEFLYLLNGQLRIQHGAQQSDLEPGDAVYFDASKSHSYICLGTTAAQAILVTMAVQPAKNPPGAERPAPAL